ncbi:MAG: NAD(P)/FAD-dependent oxidoreductase [Verrucomicrobia bacterium]|nr:NAD(P)/FAD-dependent oxidoreductase [Verrucomicrobiota bacterium]
MLHLARHGHLFGLSGGERLSVDWKALHQRKCAMVDDFKSYRQQQLQSDRFTLLREHATFVGTDTLELSPSGRRIQADRILIATGSVVAVPAIKGLDHPEIWTSDDVLDLASDPESVIVLGGGVVACELTQFLIRSGVEVTQIQRSPRILKDMSASASEVVAQALRAEGVQLITGTSLKEVQKTADGFTVDFEHAGARRQVRAKHVVNALGRVPNTDGLNLTAIGVSLKASGHVAVDSMQQTSVPGIYAAGDVAGPHEIVHVAILQGECLGRHATGRSAEPVDYNGLTSVVFTDPQVAMVGRSCDQLEASGRSIRVADYKFDDHGKSILMEARHGYVKVWADTTSGIILGAECVGKDAGELIHSMAVAVSSGLTVQQMLKVQWYHPTLSEIWTYPLEDLL